MHQSAMPTAAHCTATVEKSVSGQKNNELQKMETSHVFLVTIIKGCSSHTSSPSCTKIDFTMPAVRQRASTDAAIVIVSEPSTPWSAFTPQRSADQHFLPLAHAGETCAHLDKYQAAIDLICNKSRVCKVFMTLTFASLDFRNNRILFDLKPIEPERAHDGEDANSVSQKYTQLGHQACPRKGR